MKKMLLLIGVISLSACQKKDFLEAEVSETSIEKNAKAEDLSFPFATEEELNQFKNDPKVLHYEKARKVALLEMQATGFIEQMNWNGFHLSEKPIVFYNLSSVPKYYDYIALDSENEPIGTIRVTATKEKSTALKGMFSKTFNYNEMLSKSSATHPSFFIDWKGTEFVGMKSKSGEAPKQLIAAESGNLISQSQVKELSNQEIVDVLSEGLLPALLPKDERAFQNIPEHLIQNDTIREEIEYARNLNITMVKDSLQLALVRTEKEAKAFWNAIDEIEEDLKNTTDEELTNADSKFFRRIRNWIRRVFNFNTNTDTHYIQKYGDFNKISSYGRLKQWCGPWVCGYIVYVNQGIDKYQFFEDCSSTFGEFGIVNNLFRYLNSFPDAKTRAMFPAEISWSMPIASGRKIWVNPAPIMNNLHAYSHIRYQKKPALRLCAAEGELHWTLAFGARATGNYFWRNYYFLQIDNGTTIKEENRNRVISDSKHYTAVDWWNPWYLVYD